MQNSSIISKLIFYLLIFQRNRTLFNIFESIMVGLMLLYRRILSFQVLEQFLKYECDKKKMVYSLNVCNSKTIWDIDLI